MNNPSRFRRGNRLLIRDTHQALQQLYANSPTLWLLLEMRIFWWNAIKLDQYKVHHLSDGHLTVRYVRHLSRVSCPKQLTIEPTSIAWYSTTQHIHHTAFPRNVCSRGVQSALNETCGKYGTNVSIMPLEILLKTHEFRISTNVWNLSPYGSLFIT